MRRLVAVVLVGAASAVASGASAAPRPTTLASYCSPSGDLCFGVFDRSGAVYLELTTFARYFSRYRLCARPPGRAATCKAFPLRPDRTVWSSELRYGRHFPVVGAGSYRVTWRLGTQALGPTLRFRLPLRR